MVCIEGIRPYEGNCDFMNEKRIEIFLNLFLDDGDVWYIYGGVQDHNPFPFSSLTVAYFICCH